MLRVDRVRKSFNGREVLKGVSMIYQLFNPVDRSTAPDNVLTGSLGRTA